MNTIIRSGILSLSVRLSMTNLRISKRSTRKQLSRTISGRITKKYLNKIIYNLYSDLQVQLNVHVKYNDA